ncbi:MAG: ABC transporter permease [Alphaproteobacteria bacterium]|nr:ABC transporter permease [Alphaproteobacteria bacterium]MDX5368590.1 ABC transporter permease [Alphaproteobacteria bacterium]MDX5463335.1 ABC transporter permease [Alphaproteobacteria bacterium]
MGAYVVRRLLTMIPTLIVVSLLMFLVIELPPGDYLSNQIAELQAQGESASVAKLEFLRNEFALDRPFLERYLIWVGALPGPNGFSGILQGNFGWSFEYDRPVTDVVGQTVLLTIVLNLATVLFVYIVSFPIGIYSATRQYSWGDYGITLIGYLGLATPNFLLGLILLYYANAWFGLSVGGLMAPEYIGEPWSLAKLGSVLAHLIVPTVVIGTAGTAAMIRRLRANLLDELRKPYVTTARAKGLGERKLLMKYPLRMALNPFIADIGNLLPQLVSGSVIVSVVLNLPTVGPILLGALQSQDQYLAGFILLFVAVLTLVGMLISDLLLAVLDPRIRLDGGRTR